jgi:hypothetical protein
VSARIRHNIAQLGLENVVGFIDKMQRSREVRALAGGRACSDLVNP